MLSILFAMALTSTAQAQDLTPPMWGVGGALGTMLIPGDFPLTNPRLKGDATAPGVLLDENGKTLSEDVFTGVGGDAYLGLRGMVYMNRTWRGSADFQLGFGKNYTSRQFTLEVDKTLVGEGPISAFFGAGIGMGGMTFKSAGAAEDASELNAEIVDSAMYKARTFPVRARVGADYRLNKSMFELSLFGQLPLPSQQTLYYDDAAGAAQEAEVGVGFNPLQYVQVGIELSGYYGDFKTREGGKNKGKRNKGGKK